ncbi:EboA domain-containing protein, partial [Streptomyces sp. NPDC054844]
MTQHHATHAIPSTQGADGTPGGRAPQGTTPAHVPPADLRATLTAELGGAARAWLDQALAQAAAHPGSRGPISVWEL